MLIFLFVLIPFLVYCLLLFYFIIGAGRLYKKSLKKTSSKLPSISVVVPIRNEEKTLLDTLIALSNQDYKGEWEVICVNDRSTDSTHSILEEFTGDKKKFSCFDVPSDSPIVTSPKKRALQLGFENAKGEILITTDADCLPPVSWLKSMAKNFTDSIGIVQGPKKIIGKNYPWIIYQKLEVFAFVSIEAATFSMGKPMIASAPSLAYRKALYEKSGGFDGLEHLVSGDDDMLVHKMVKQPGGKVRYNLDTSAFVSTPAAPNWKTMILQRARWSSNGAHYQDKKFVLMLLMLFVFYVWMLISPLIAWMGLISWAYFLLPFGGKCIMDFIFLFQTSIKFKQKHLLLHFAWCQIIHVPIIVLSVVLGIFGLYKWK